MTTDSDASEGPPSLAISLTPDEPLSSLSALSLLFKEHLGKPEISQDLRGIVEKLNVQLNSNTISLRPTSIRELVNSLGEDYKRWCMLEADAFAVVTRTLLRSRNCLERDQGLFRLIEVLETLSDGVETRGVECGAVRNYKDTVGEGSISELLSFFTEEENLDFTRRWVGLLLVELLDGSEQNRKRLLKTEKKRLEELGDIIERGTDRMLKIVAGKIIWQTIRSSSVLGDIRKGLEIFWSRDSIDFSKDFPIEPGSQWDGGFARFVTRLEEDLDDDIGLFPIAFNAYQVRLGENKPQVFGRGAVSISIGELFSIYIPPDSNCSCEWIDLKITNITKIEPINEAVPGDLKGQLRYLKLHLSDSSNSGYLYLISMRPSSRFDNIMVSCYAEEADDIVENVERCRGLILSSKQGDIPHVSAVSGMLVNPEISQSQKEKEEELQKRRGYVLDAVNSPAGAEATSSGQSESGEILSVSTADLENTYDGASLSIISRDPMIDLSRGGEGSVQSPRPPNIETRPKQVQEGTRSRGLGENELNQANDEPTDGLSSILQRVPSLISLEEVKRRGKLKDRLANERGELPTPPSLQKQNTGRKRITAKRLIEPTRPAETAKPVPRKAGDGGTAKSIKPVVQRKRPEPLPISDDIWELPLSSPVSQGLKAGGGGRDLGAGINKKAKHAPKQTGIVKGQLTVKGKTVPGNRGRGKGRSYKSETLVVDSSEESTPHSASEPIGPGAPHSLGEMGIEKSAPTPQPKALIKTAQTTQTTGAQHNPRRSLRERKPPKAVLIPSSDRESGGEEPVECTPRKAATRPLSPGRKRESVMTNKRAFPEAYKTDPPIKKRKDAPTPGSIDARRGSRAVKLGKKQKDAGGPRVAGGKTSAVALEHIQNHKTTAMSSKRKAHKPTVTPKEFTEGSHKRQRTSPPKTVGHGNRGGARAPTLDASANPEALISASQMDVALEVRDSTREGPDLDGRVAGNDDVLPPLNKKECVNHGGGRGEGRTSNISGLTKPSEPNAQYTQTAQELPGGFDDGSKETRAHDRGSQKRRHSSLEHFPRELLPRETMNNFLKRPSSVDTLVAYSPLGSSTAPHSPQENLPGNALAASVNISKALTPYPLSNLVDASTSTTDLNEDSVIGTSRSRTLSPPLQITGENVSTIRKQMPGVTSPVVQLRDKVTCDRAVSADAVSDTAISELHPLNPIKFSKENSPTGPLAHNATLDEDLSTSDDLARLSATQRLQSLVILSDGDEDIVVWDTKGKRGGLITLQRTETRHTEVDENGSPSRPGAPRPPVRPKKVSREILNKSKDPVSESSQEPETEENKFVENLPNILGEMASLGRLPFVEKTHRLVRTRAKGGKPENPGISTGGGGDPGYLKHEDRATSYIKEPKGKSTELPKPLEKLRGGAKDVISISSTSPSPTLPLSLPPKKSHRTPVCQEPEPWEDSDDAEYIEPATAKVLQMLAKRGTSMPKSSPPVLHHSKPKVQLIRNGRRKLEDNGGLAQRARVEATSTEDRPFEDTALTKKGYSKTHFSKMLRNQRFVRAQRPPYHGNPPDRRLIVEQLHRASRVVPIKGEQIRRQEWIEDSDQDELDGDTGVEDSMGAYKDGNGHDVSTDAYSDSESSGSGDSGDEDESGEEGEEDAHIIWRKSLPGHLKETLSALEQITRGLVDYLVCSEELAIEMIEKFEAQGTRLIQALDDSHAQEYNEFLENLEEAKRAVVAKAEELDQLIRNGLDSIERKEEDWRNSQTARKEQRQKLYNAIEEILTDTNN